MRNLLLAAFVFAIGACSATGTRSKSSVAETPSSTTPLFGRIARLYEVRDQDTQELVGYVELTKYDNGQDLYWVRNKERTKKLGYILTNNQGYRYEWFAGKRSEKPEPIGADTISSNSRRILRYTRPVELNETSLRELAKKIQSQRETQKTAAPAKAEEAGADEE